MNEELVKLMNELNEKVFSCNLLEYRHGLNETDRLRVKDIYNNKKFMKDHFLDDLFEVGKNNSLFTERCKKIVLEVASKLNIKVKFMYSQCIVLDK